MKTASIGIALVVAAALGSTASAFGQGFSFGDLIPAVRQAKEAKSLVEIDQLAQAVNAYREKNLEYPPAVGAVDSSDRKARLMKHLAVAFPNSGYGAGADGYDRLSRLIRETWKYDYVAAGGEIGLLDLDRIDPAESLVFWLGGFPTPIDRKTNRPVSTQRLFGFHRDSDNPLKRDAPAIEEYEPLRYRTDMLFSFDPTRLVDNDRDGWPEYVPAAPREGELIAPFVYFDAESYAETTKTAAARGTCFYPRDPKLTALWGTAAPYLQAFDPQQPDHGAWAKPTQFQIIGCGLDGKYGPVGAADKPPPRRLTTLDPRQTFTAADEFRTPQALDKAEQDNLTNLSNKPIGTTP